MLSKSWQSNESFTAQICIRKNHNWSWRETLLPGYVEDLHAVIQGSRDDIFTWTVIADTGLTMTVITSKPSHEQQQQQPDRYWAALSDVTVTYV